MSDFRSSRPLYAAVLGLLLTGSVLALGGCSEKEAGAMEAEAGETAAYRIGDPITDTSIAMVVSSQFGTDTLTAQDYYTRFNMVVQQFPTIEGNPEQMAELQRTLAEEFILQHLITGEADRLNLVADTAQVNDQLRRIRGQFPNEEAFQQALASENMTEDSLRANITEFVRTQMLQQRFQEGAVNPSEGDIEAFRNEQAEEVRAQHILFLVPPGAPEQQQDSVEAVAQAVLDTAKQGTVPFDELARRHSQDGSAQAGGDLNYFRRGQMVEPFEEAAFALADSGDVTPELVRTRFGYHIIRLTDRRTAELMDTTRARQMLLAQRRQEAVESEVERLKKQVTVQLNPNIIKADINEPREQL